jgi:hypothetical protein
MWLKIVMLNITDYKDRKDETTVIQQRFIYYNKK